MSAPRDDAAASRVRTRLDPELRRQQILEAADRVLQGRQPSEVTFEEIADAAGVSRALVYNYFGDRGGLIAAVYLRSFGRLDDELAAAVDPSLAPPERIRQIVHCYLRFAEANAGAWTLLAVAGAFQHPAVQAARRERFERIAGAWGEGPDAVLVVRAVVGLLEAATLDWLERRHQRGAVDLEHAADVLFTLLWRGLSEVDRHDVALPLVASTSGGAPTHHPPTTNL
ncbi:hypothetical protein BH20ACT2_BH20ACT2_13330 [soil metagenome]